MRGCDPRASTNRVLFAFLLSFCACRSQARSSSASVSDTAAAPKPAEPDRSPVFQSGDAFALRDSGKWECGGNGGTFAALYRGSAFVDSIEVETGFQVTPQGVIFSPVLTEDQNTPERAICPADPVLWDGRTRRPLNQVLPFFDAHFPVRTLVDSALFYWGFVRYRAYAVRYDFATRRTDTTFLVEDASLFATDNQFQFLPPVLSDSTLIYETSIGSKFVLDGHLRLRPSPSK